MAEFHYYIVHIEKKPPFSPKGPAFHWFSAPAEKEPIADLAVRVRLPYLMYMNEWLVMKAPDLFWALMPPNNNSPVPDIVDAKYLPIVDAFNPMMFDDILKPPPPSTPLPPRMPPGPRPPPPPPPALPPRPPPPPGTPPPYPEYPFYPQSFSLYTPVASRFGNRRVAYFLGMWPKYEDWSRRPDDINIWPIRGLIVAGNISQQPQLRREIDYRWIYKERLNGRREVPGGYTPLHYIDECYLLHPPAKKEYDETRMCTFRGDGWTEYDSLHRMNWSKTPQFETPP